MRWEPERSSQGGERTPSGRRGPGRGPGTLAGP